MKYKTKWNKIWNRTLFNGILRMPNVVLEAEVGEETYKTEDVLDKNVLSRAEAHILEQMCFFEQEKVEYTLSDLLSAVKYDYDSPYNCSTDSWEILSSSKFKECCNNLVKKGYVTCSF